MKFYEASDFGARVITVEYVQKTNYALKIRLIPMCHIGESEYYEKVSNYLLSYDQVLFEGVKFKSGKINLKNRKRLASRLNLVVQPKFHKQESEIVFIQADLNEERGLKEWNTLTRLHKIKYIIVYPFWIFFSRYELFKIYFCEIFHEVERRFRKNIWPSI
jgi:hypothetical protein